MSGITDSNSIADTARNSWLPYTTQAQISRTGTSISSTAPAEVEVQGISPNGEPLALTIIWRKCYRTSPVFSGLQVAPDDATQFINIKHIREIFVQNSTTLSQNSWRDASLVQHLSRFVPPQQLCDRAGVNVAIYLGSAHCLKIDSPPPTTCAEDNPPPFWNKFLNGNRVSKSHQNGGVVEDSTIHANLLREPAKRVSITFYLKPVELPIDYCNICPAFPVLKTKLIHN